MSRGVPDIRRLASHFPRHSASNFTFSPDLGPRILHLGVWRDLLEVAQFNHAIRDSPSSASFMQRVPASLPGPCQLLPPGIAFSAGKDPRCHGRLSTSDSLAFWCQRKIGFMTFLLTIARAAASSAFLPLSSCRPSVDRPHTACHRRCKKAVLQKTKTESLAEKRRTHPAFRQDAVRDRFGCGVC